MMNNLSKIEGFVEYCYLIGSILYIPASVLIFFPECNLQSTIIFIIASAIFLVGGIKDCIVPIKNMTPHVIFNLFGGFLFTLGSFLFLCISTTRVGIWVFRCGSCCYIAGGILYLIKSKNDIDTNTTNTFKLKLLSTIQYICGSCLFITGGILSEIKVTYIAFATIWTIGSCLFTGGAITSYCLLFKTSTLRTIQLNNN